MSSSLPSRGAVPHLPDGVTVNAGTTYSTVEASAASGATVRQLNYWASLGYLQPTWAGRWRRWTQREVDAAARFMAVLEVVRDGTVLNALAYGDPVSVALKMGRFTVSIHVAEVSRAE